MGVAGLTSFIDNNLQLIEAYKLCNTKLVIDGNNLLHLLYYDHSIDYKHGGDYDHFERHTIRFFDMLDKCGVVPYVVFDGAYNIDDRKLQTSLQRAKQRIDMASMVTRGYHGRSPRILPLLTYITFLDILQEKCIAHCVCHLEADDQIAVLGNQWECPVLSFDSDFYVYNMKGGFIPFDGLQLRVCSDEKHPEEKFIPATIYFAENFYKHFPKLGADVLPLLATLLGNDFVDADLFENFLQQLKKHKHKTTPFTIPSAHTRFLSIIHWLMNLESMQDGIQRMVSTVKPQMTAKVKSNIERSIKMYVDVTEFKSVNLKNLFEHVPDLNQLCSQREETLPDWYHQAYWNGKILPFCRNTMTLHRNINLCQLENTKEVSTYDCCLGIRKIIYGILLLNQSAKQELYSPKKASKPSSDNSSKVNLEKSTDCAKEKVCIEADDHIIVTEYNRDKNGIRKFIIHPQQSFEDYGSLPSLCDIEHLDTAARQQIIFQAVFQSNKSFCDIPDELNLVTLAICHWINHSNPKVTLNQLKSILCCVVAMNSNKSHNMDKKHQETKDSFSKYFKAMEHSRKQPLDINYLHNFAQFQACYLSLTILNQILNQPFTTLSPSKFYNGTFLYRLNRELDYRPNVDSYIEDILGKQSERYNSYNTFFTCILSRTSKCALLDPISTNGVPRRPRKRQKHKNSSQSEKRRKSSSQSRSSSDESENLSKYDVNNRFGVLSIGE